MLCLLATNDDGDCGDYFDISKLCRRNNTAKGYFTVLEIVKAFEVSTREKEQGITGMKTAGNSRPSVLHNW